MPAAIPKKKNPYAHTDLGLIDWTVGAEAANVIKVTAKLKTVRNKAITERRAVRVWLTQSATTLAIAGTAPSGTVVIAAKGSVLATVTAKLFFHIITDAAGEFDLNITEVGAATWYVVVQLDDGTLLVSPAVTFA